MVQREGEWKRDTRRREEKEKKETCGTAAEFSLGGGAQWSVCMAVGVTQSPGAGPLVVGAV